MNHTLLFALLASSCAHKPTAAAAFDAANKGLAGLDLVVDGSKVIVDEATEVRMQRCASAEDRKACMGKLGLEVAPIYEGVGAAYDAAVRALAELEKAYGELAPIVEDASKELAK